MLAFQIDPEVYALDIARFSEIMKPCEFIMISGLQGFILGLISLGDVVVTVFTWPACWVRS